MRFTVHRTRATKKHISKNKDRDIQINPLIKQPNKVGISPKNAYAYVLFGPLKNTMRMTRRAFDATAIDIRSSSEETDSPRAA